MRPWAALLVLCALCVAGPAGAQERRALQDDELDFQAALTTHQAAVAAEEVASRRFTRALAELEAAQAAGDQDRANRAFSAMLDASDELERQQRRVEDTRERLHSAGTELVAALVDRRGELLAESDSLPSETTAEAREISILLVDLTNRIREVEGAITRPVEEGIPGLPPLDIAATDGREEIELKASFLETRAAQFDSTLVDIDQRIEVLQRRLRDDRRVRDLVSTIERFDDTRLPVLPQAEAGGEGEEGESLSDRIQGLVSLRERLIDYRDWALNRARSFRRRIPGGSLDNLVWVA